MSIAGPPPELEWVTFLLVGEKFPRGDEDRMHLLAAAWRQLAEDLAPLADQLREVQERLADAGNTPGIETARDAISQLSGQFNVANSELHTALGEVAQGARTIAQEIEHAKLMIIAFAAMLALSLVQLIISAVFSMGTTGPAAAAVTETFREMARRVLIRLLHTVIGGAVFMGGLDAAIQLIQIHLLGTRRGDEFNWKKVGLMAGIGGLAGAFGVSLSIMRGMFTRHQVLLNEGFLFSVLRNLTSEGTAEYLADLLTQKGKITDTTHTSAAGGALSGAIEGAVDHARGTLGRRGAGGSSQLALDLGNMFGSTKGLDAAIAQLLRATSGMPQASPGIPDGPGDGAHPATTRQDTSEASRQETAQRESMRREAAQWLTGKVLDRLLPEHVGTPAQREQLRAVWQLAGHDYANGSGTYSLRGWETLVRQLGEFSQVAGDSYPAWAGLTHVELVTGPVADAAIELWQAQHPDKSLSAAERIMLRDTLVAEARETYIANLKQSAAGATPDIAHAQTAVARTQAAAAHRMQEAGLTMLVESDAAAKGMTKAVTAAPEAEPRRRTPAEPPAETHTPPSYPDIVVLSASSPLPEPSPSALALAPELTRATSVAPQAPGVAHVSVASSAVTPVAAPVASAVAESTADNDEELRYLVVDMDEHLGIDGGHAVQTRSGWYLAEKVSTAEELTAAQAIPQLTTASGVDYLVLAVHVAGGVFRFAGRDWTAADFAAVIRSLPDSADRPVVLVSCNAADLAAQLRDTLGVAVIAANAPVLSTPDGITFAGQIQWTASGAPHVIATGQWLLLEEQAGSTAKPYPGPWLAPAVALADESARLANLVEWGKFKKKAGPTNDDEVPPNMRSSLDQQDHVRNGLFRASSIPGSPDVLIGLHQWHPTMDETLTFTLMNTYPGGVTSGHIEPKAIAHQFQRKFSTLFPEHLTWSQLRTMAGQAYVRAVAAGPLSESGSDTGYDLANGQWQGRDDDGFPIVGRFGYNGEVTSFYPSTERSHYGQFDANGHPFFAVPISSSSVPGQTQLQTTQPVIAQPVIAQPVTAQPATAQSTVAESVGVDEFTLEPEPADGVSQAWAEGQIDRLLQHVDELLFSHPFPRDLHARVGRLSDLLETLQDRKGVLKLSARHTARYGLIGSDLDWLRRASVNKKGNATWPSPAIWSRHKGLLHTALADLNATQMPIDLIQRRLDQLKAAAPALDKNSPRYLAANHVIDTELILAGSARGWGIQGPVPRLFQTNTQLPELARHQALDLDRSHQWLTGIAARLAPGHEAIGRFLRLSSTSLAWQMGHPLTVDGVKTAVYELLVYGTGLVRDGVVTVADLKELYGRLSGHPSMSRLDFERADSVKPLMDFAKAEIDWMSRPPVRQQDVRDRFRFLTEQAVVHSSVLGPAWITARLAELSAKSTLPPDVERRLPIITALVTVMGSRRFTRERWEAWRRAVRAYAPRMDDLSGAGIGLLLRELVVARMVLHAVPAFADKENLLADLRRVRAEVLVRLAQNLPNSTPAIFVLEMALLADLSLGGADGSLQPHERQNLLGRVRDLWLVYPPEPVARPSRLAMTMLFSENELSPTQRSGMVRRVFDAVQANLPGYGNVGVLDIVADLVTTLGAQVSEASWQALRSDVERRVPYRAAPVTPVPQQPAVPLPRITWVPDPSDPGARKRIDAATLRHQIHHIRLLQGEPLSLGIGVSTTFRLVSDVLMPAFYQGKLGSEELRADLTFIEQNAHESDDGIIGGESSHTHVDVVRTLVRLFRSDIDWFEAKAKTIAATESRLSALESAGRELVEMRQIAVDKLHGAYGQVLLASQSVDEASTPVPAWPQLEQALKIFGYKQVSHHGLAGWINPDNGVAWWITASGLLIGSPMISQAQATALDSPQDGGTAAPDVLIGHPGSPVRPEWIAALAELFAVADLPPKAIGAVTVNGQRTPGVDQAVNELGVRGITIRFATMTGLRAGAPSQPDGVSVDLAAGSSQAQEVPAAQRDRARLLLDDLPEGSHLHARYRDELAAAAQLTGPDARLVFDRVVGQLESLSLVLRQLTPLVRAFSRTTAVTEPSRSHAAVRDLLARLTDRYTSLLWQQNPGVSVDAQARAFGADLLALETALGDWNAELVQIGARVDLWVDEAIESAWEQPSSAPEGEFAAWAEGLRGRADNFREGVNGLRTVADGSRLQQLWTLSQTWYAIRTEIAANYRHTGAYPDAVAVDRRVDELNARVEGRITTAEFAELLSDMRVAHARLGQSVTEIASPRQLVAVEQLLRRAEEEIDLNVFQVINGATYREYWESRVPVVSDVDGDVTPEALVLQAQATPNRELRLLVSDGAGIAELQEWANRIDIGILVTPAGADAVYARHADGSAQAVAVDRATGHVVAWTVVTPASRPSMVLHIQRNGVVLPLTTPFGLQDGEALVVSDREHFRQDVVRAAVWRQRFAGLPIAPVSVRLAEGLVQTGPGEAASTLTEWGRTTAFEQYVPAAGPIALDFDWPADPVAARALHIEVSMLAEDIHRPIYVRDPEDPEVLDTFMPYESFQNLPSHLPVAGGGLVALSEPGIGVPIGEVISTVVDVDAIRDHLRAVVPSTDLVTIHIEFDAGGHVRLLAGSGPAAPVILVSPRTLALVLRSWGAGPTIPRLLVRGSRFADAAAFQQIADFLMTEVHWADEGAIRSFRRLTAAPATQLGVTPEMTWRTARPRDRWWEGPLAQAAWFDTVRGNLILRRSGFPLRINFSGGAASMSLADLRNWFLMLQLARSTPGIRTLLLPGGLYLDHDSRGHSPLRAEILQEWFADDGAVDYRIMTAYSDALADWMRGAARKVNRAIWVSAPGVEFTLHRQSRQFLTDRRGRPVDWRSFAPNDLAPLHQSVRGLLELRPGEITFADQNVMVLASRENHYQEVMDNLRPGLPAGVVAFWAQTGGEDFRVYRYDGTVSALSAEDILERLNRLGRAADDEIVYLGPSAADSTEALVRLAQAAGVAIHVPTLSPFGVNVARGWQHVLPEVGYRPRFAPDRLGRLWEVGTQVVVRGRASLVDGEWRFAGVGSPTEEMLGNALSSYHTDQPLELFFVDLPLAPRTQAGDSPLGVVVDDQVVPITGAELGQLLRRNDFAPSAQAVQVLTAYPQDRAEAFAHQMRALADELGQVVSFLPPGASALWTPANRLLVDGASWLTVGPQAAAEVVEVVPVDEELPQYIQADDFQQLSIPQQEMTISGSAFSLVRGFAEEIVMLGENPDMITVVVEVNESGRPIHNGNLIGPDEATNIIEEIRRGMAETATHLPIRLILLGTGRLDSYLSRWAYLLAEGLRVAVYYPSRYPGGELQADLGVVMGAGHEVSATWDEVLPPDAHEQLPRLVQDDVSGYLVSVASLDNVAVLPHTYPGSSERTFAWQQLFTGDGIEIVSGEGVPQADPSGAHSRVPSWPGPVPGHFLVLADGAVNVVYGRSPVPTAGFDSGGPAPVAPWELAEMIREAGHSERMPVVLAVPFIGVRDPGVPMAEAYGQLLANEIDAVVYATRKEMRYYASRNRHQDVTHSSYFARYTPMALVHEPPVATADGYVLTLPLFASGWFGLTYDRDDVRVNLPALPGTIAAFIRSSIPAGQRERLVLRAEEVQPQKAPERARKMRELIEHFVLAEGSDVGELAPSYVDAPFFSWPRVLTWQFEQLRDWTESAPELQSQITLARERLAGRPDPLLQWQLEEAESRLRQERDRHASLRLAAPRPSPGPATPDIPTAHRTPVISDYAPYITSHQRLLAAFAAVREAANAINTWEPPLGSRLSVASAQLRSRLADYGVTAVAVSVPHEGNDLNSFLNGLRMLLPDLAGMAPELLRDVVAVELETDLAEGSPRFAQYLDGDHDAVLDLMRTDSDWSPAGAEGHREAIMEIVARVLNASLRILEPVMDYTVGDVTRPAYLMLRHEGRYGVVPDVQVPPYRRFSRTGRKGVGADPSPALAASSWPQRLEILRAAWNSQHQWLYGRPPALLPVLPTDVMENNASALDGVRAGRYELLRLETTPGGFVRSHRVRVTVKDGFFNASPQAIHLAQNTIRRYAEGLNARALRFPNGDQWHLTVDFPADPTTADITLDGADPRSLGRGLLRQMEYGDGMLSPTTLARIDEQVHQSLEIPITSYADVVLARRLHALTGAGLGQLDGTGDAFDALAQLHTTMQSGAQARDFVVSRLRTLGADAIPAEYRMLTDESLVAAGSSLTAGDVVSGRLVALSAAILGLSIHLLLPDNEFGVGLDERVLIVGRHGVYTVFPEHRLSAEDDFFAVLTTYGPFVNED